MKVEATDGALIIEGERKRDHKVDEEGYHRYERSFGKFHRSIPLPDGGNQEEARADLNDGVLKISVPAAGSRWRGRTRHLGGATEMKQGVRQMHEMNGKDRQLRDAVMAQLEWDPQVTSNDISVAAADHVITLTGFVHNYNEKYAAENAAKSVYGVQAVANDIEVKLKAERTDPEIARDVAHAVELDVRIPEDGIKAAVQNGFVTLDGTVEWNFQRTSVEACARQVSGVRGVMNHIVVKPQTASSTDVLHKIEGALRRTAAVDARRITVATKDSQVHLYGSVRSWAERDEAEHAAWAAPGVNDVIDHISVVP